MLVGVWTSIVEGHNTYEKCFASKQKSHGKHMNNGRRRYEQ